MTVWFDVEDLFDYVRAGHRRVSGIQRLTLEIYRAAAELGGVGFVRHAPSPTVFQVVPWAVVESLFKDGPASAPLAARRPPTSVVRRPLQLVRPSVRGMVRVLPDRVRKPLVLATVTQAQAAAAMVMFAAGLGMGAVRRGRQAVRRRLTRRRVAGRVETGVAFATVARPGDTLLVLGSPWFESEYGAIARWLRDENRVGFGVLMCDLVPVRHPEWCDEGIRRVFRAWYSSVLPFCDLVLAISRHTGAAVGEYAHELGITLPRPVRVIPIGTGFASAPAAGDDGPDKPYVLFVSTLEARKNHALAVEVWRRLLDEERGGARTPGSVPDLVFAGRVGWMVADLMQELENSAWLGGRIRLVAGPSDAELQRLYDGCLFTLFPSLHEGWGLPVTESLARGTPCVCSNAASLPEAGGELCRYFDPESVPSARDAVATVLDDPAALAAWRARVRQEFRPVSWSESARAVLDEAAEAMGVG